MSFLFALVDAHIAETLTKCRPGLCFLAHHSTERKRQKPRLSRGCQRPALGGGRWWGDPRREKRWTEAIHRCSRGAVSPVAVWPLWSGLRSLPGGGLDRNLLL